MSLVKIRLAGVSSSHPSSRSPERRPFPADTAPGPGGVAETPLDAAGKKAG